MQPYYQKGGITIYCGECSKVMETFEPATFDLTVTSPPYDEMDADLNLIPTLRDYNGYTLNFGDVARQLYRVTADGGVVVWVVGDATIDGSETFTSLRQALYFRDVCGFKAHDTMIYETNKPPMNDNRYQHEFEYMFIFSKKFVSVFNPVVVPKIYSDTRKNNKYHRYSNGEYRVNKRSDKDYKVKGNIWRIKNGGGISTNDKSAHQHPAIFPEALARDHIISWSNPGNIVLDPLCGSGTTLKMAQELGRRAVGVEISEEYCKIAVDRLRQPSFFSIPETPTAGEVKVNQGELFLSSGS